MRTAVLSALTALFLAAPALADDNTIALPPAGSTLINLNVSETIKMPQDMLEATLNYEIDGTSANEVQDRINKSIAQAVAEAKKEPAVKTTTGYYNVYVYDETPQGIDPRTGKPIGTPVRKWKGAQSLDLKGTDATKLLELAGKIQAMGFTMSGLTYSLSDEKAEGVRDELMQKVLKKLADKAKLAQTALGKASYDIVSVNVDGASQPVYPMVKTFARAEMAMAADAAAPVAAPTAQAGETEVSMSVSAQVLLK